MTAAWGCDSSMDECDSTMGVGRGGEGRRVGGAKKRAHECSVQSAVVMHGQQQQRRKQVRMGKAWTCKAAWKNRNKSRNETRKTTNPARPETFRNRAISFV
jgi:hypothetical protein